MPRSSSTAIIRTFPVRPARRVDAALRAGLDLPYSCRGGMCCTCRAKMIEGEVEMDQNYSLEPWEIAAGYVLTCQIRPRTAKVALDYDPARARTLQRIAFISERHAAAGL